MSLGDLLARNARLRNLFADDPQSRARLLELQDWQSRRLERTHAALLAEPHYRPAAEFFLRELYGGDAKARDRDLVRVQRVMERLLPGEALRALMLAIELEVLSQELDGDMVQALPRGPITEASYAEAYRRTGRRSDRERQIELIGDCGNYLDRLVRLPLVHALVRLTRAPAHAAGFGALQEFLERGMESFAAMRGARGFVATIGGREAELMRRLFDGDPKPFRTEP